MSKFFLRDVKVSALSLSRFTCVFPDACLCLPAGGQQTGQLPFAAQSHDLHHPEPRSAGPACVAQETWRATHAYLRSIGWHPALRLPPAEPQEHPKLGK